MRAHSAYSLSQGAIKVDQLVDLAKDNEMPALAMTDSGNMFGALEFSQLAVKSGVQPIIGVEINLEIDVEKPTGKLVLLASNEVGYYNLIKIVSRSFLEAEDSSNPIVKINWLENGACDGIIALTGGYDGLLNRAIFNGQDSQSVDILLSLKNLFCENLYIELIRHDLPREDEVELVLIDLAFEHDIPLVATNDCMFKDKEMFEAQDILMCIAGGNYVSDASRKRYTPQYYFKSQEEMCQLFADIPEALENSINVAKKCTFVSPARDPMLPSMGDEAISEDDELRRIAKEGLQIRLNDVVFRAELRKLEKASPDDKITLSDEQKQAIAKPYWQRLDFELDIICQMGFPGYFLIVSDFISWAKKQDIPVGPGRGSGAGSVVAWVMLITDLDPLRYGLLFERFLNPERVSMPDFDIDFCQDRREEVINYVQDKYGHDRVAQIITFGKLQAKAVLRDVGRVLQMSYSQVDRLSKLIPFNPANPLSLQEAMDLDSTFANEARSDEQVAKLLEISLKLEGLFRHAGTHAAGVVIGAKPLEELVPLYQDSRQALPATQFSMKYAEMAGLVKFDFLGLKTLTTIANVCKIIGQQGGGVDIDHIPIDDLATFEMLSAGDSTGVFQMESAGMRDALRKMKPDTIEDIIALISLYRPGPMENIPTYIARKHGLEAPDYMHPNLEPCLKETFGVIIYQEQVMEIARVLSGYSLGGADLLRRAMGKKIAAEMDKQREMFMEGALKNDVDPKKAGEIFDLVAKFAGYGFNKSHAAAYAWIGYQTAYLKANYPVEFLAGSMNIDIGDTDKLNIFVQEAIYSKIQVLPPDINKSCAYFTVEKLLRPDENGRNRAIRYGLAGLKGVGLDAMEELIKQRNDEGIFQDIFEMTERCDSKIINKRQIEGLAKAGAFDSLGLSRHCVVQSAPALIKYNQAISREKQSNQNSLFGDDNKQAVPTNILQKLDEWSDAQKYAQEFSAIGFYLTGHPLQEYQEDLRGIPRYIYANEQNKKISMEGGKYRICGIVTSVNIRSSQRGRFAYIHISDPTGDIETSLFNEGMIDENLENFDSKRPILFTVDARRDEGGTRLQIEKIQLLDDYLEDKKMAIDIYLNAQNINQESLAVLQSSLQKNPKARAKIKLLIVSGAEMNVEITLDGFYALPSDYSNIFSDMQIIEKIAVK